MLTICKKFTFEACHHLPWHGGKCRNLHGHSYKIFVYAKGEPNKQGLLMDFTELSKYMNEIIEDYDHQDLNQFAEFRSSPTAERMAQIILERLQEQDSRIFKVRVYETEKCYAEYEN